MSRPTTRLQWTDWLLFGAPLLIAGVLIFVVVVLFEWRARPGSPWGKALAGFFFENPSSALVLIALGGFGVAKAVLEYRSQ
jgi:hypothetical protein